MHVGSSTSCLTLPSFFLLLHVASLLAGDWLLISFLVWRAWSSLTPFPWADPISIRSQAMPHSCVGHTIVQTKYIYYKEILIWSLQYMFVAFFKLLMTRPLSFGWDLSWWNFSFLFLQVDFCWHQPPRCRQRAYWYSVEKGNFCLWR